MKALVTGGTGFTGTHLTRRLLRAGHQVVVISTEPGLSMGELRSLGADIHLGSVTDRDLVNHAVRGCEVVFHLAAMFRLVNQPARRYFEVNVEGTRAVLEAALRHGVRKVVNCSTCGVHGNVAAPPATEDSPIGPEDCYQQSKYQAEQLATSFAEKGLRVASIRPTAIYGPGDPGRFLKLFRMVARKRFWMFGDGRVCYHPAYIENVLDAFELAAASPRGDGEAYLIGDAQYYTLDDLVLNIAEAMKVDLTVRHLPYPPLWAAAAACELLYKPFRAEPPLFRRRVHWFRQNRAFSIDKARRELGYAPRFNLQEGLARTVAWYREHGYLPGGPARAQDHAAACAAGGSTL